MSVRLLYLVSHPIQYQAPLLRRIAQEPGILLKVLFIRDTSSGYDDPGFGRRVKWDGDFPLREGYENAVVSGLALFRHIRDCDVLWLHGWHGPSFWSALGIAWLLNKPVLMRGENTIAAMPDGQGIRGWAKRRYVSAVFSGCSQFLAIGSDNRDYYLAHGVDLERIALMPYAVDNMMFARAAEMARANRSELRRQLGLSDTQKVILFAGKLQARKRPDLLLRAWRRANWQGERPALVFVGDGELMAQLQARRDKDVSFIGFVNQSTLPAYYDLADLFVLPSVQEPWGLAVNEAMACGTAAIVTDEVGAARDLIHDGNGYVIPVDHVGRLSQVLVAGLAQSEELGRKAQSSIMAWGFEQDVIGLRDSLDRLGFSR